MKLLNLILILFLISGCAIKDDDNTLVKSLKYTVNTPMYVLVGTGALLEMAMIGAIAAPIYLADKITPKDLTELKNKANANDKIAQRKLASMYYYGNNVDKNHKKAFEWYQKSAIQGDENSQNMLGIMYRYAYGVEADINKSISWYKKSVEQGNHYAMNNLGHLYITTEEDIQKDYKEAFKLLNQSQMQGNNSAMSNLGLMYENGYGVEKDAEKALKWYKKAYERGNKEAKKRIDILSKSS